MVFTEWRKGPLQFSGRIKINARVVIFKICKKLMQLADFSKALNAGILLSIAAAPTGDNLMPL